MYLFDLDGTLIDSNGLWVDIDLDFLGRHGLTPTEEYGYAVGSAIVPIAAEFTRTYYNMDLTAQEIMDEWMTAGRAAYAGVAMRPGALAFLRRCRDQGKPMALLTACVPELCRIALDRHGLTAFFSDIIFAQELGVEKRDPRYYQLALERLGVPPEACVFFEDAPSNCASARDMGITVIGLADPFYARKEAEMRTHCHRFIPDFTVLLEGPLP